MGEIADDMVEGRACELCGSYFQDKNTDNIYEHGFPVVCKDCWFDMTNEERKGYTKASVDTF